MLESLRRLGFLWVVLLIALASCSADTHGPDGVEGAGGGAVAPAQGPTAQAAMPASLRMAWLRSQQTAAGYDFVRDAGGTLRSKAGRHGATAEIAATARGVRLSSAEAVEDGGFELEVGTTSVGRGASPASRGVIAQRAEGQELVLEREDGVEERYLAGPLGVEQSYLVRERPAGHGPLVIAVAFAGLVPELADGAADRVLLVDDEGQVRAGYRDLVVADAEGREIAAQMEVRGGSVALVIDDVGASYPLEVDPLVWVQQQKLSASDGAAGDVFGVSVAVSGDTAVIGAYHDDDKGGDSGSAYVFVRSGAVWTEQQKLTASDGAAGDVFGVSVAVSGDTAVIGAYHDDDKGGDSGSAYVFVRSGGVWTQQKKLTASDGAAFDYFGRSVAVSGDTAVIGAYFDDVQGSLSGSAYVFVRSGGVWTQQKKLTASDGAAFDYFGSSVAVSGDTAVIGTLLDDDKGSDSGSAYVFVRSGGVWTEQQKLTASDGAATDYFGFSVAVSGDTAVIGTPYDDDKGSNSGSAYVFVRSGGVWTEQQKLTASDGAATDYFGFSVAVSGDTAVIGTPYDDDKGSNSGSAYVFVRSGGVWTEQQNLTANDGAAGDNFGYSVAVSGDTAVIGAVGDDDQGTNSGSAYVFTLMNKANGEACAAGSECASAFCADGVCCNTACDAGTCDACSIAAGAASDGTCALLTGPACDDADACTQSDTCQAGACTGSNPVICAAQDGCHDPGTCDPATGVCSNPSKADGSACDDADACTQSDTCQAGACTGSNPVTCAAQDGCHDAGTCDPATGVCASPNKADGTACDDGNACTQSDSCQAGSCAGADPVACTAQDQCHDVGTCDPATGVCSDPAKADGSACDDGDACSQTDACESGACVGADAKSCPAIDECHEAGTCDTATGDCSAPAKSDGEPCSVGTCQAGVCAPGPDGGTGGAGGASTSTGAGTSTGGTGASTSSGLSGSGPDESGGCGCRLAGADEDAQRGPIGLLVGVMLAAGVGRRRRRRSRRAA